MSTVLDCFEISGPQNCKCGLRPITVLESVPPEMFIVGSKFIGRLKSIKGKLPRMIVSIDDWELLRITSKKTIIKSNILGGSVISTPLVRFCILVA
ncbi:hypothetical protein QTP88_026830 [Uroleucon formosanum]